jgi:hypothetical protein
VGEGQQGEIKLSVPAYDRSKGVIAPVEGGDVTVELDGDGILIRGSGAGLRDLARWCMALADPDAPEGAHIHLDPGAIPLTLESLPVLIAREADSAGDPSP